MTTMQSAWMFQQRRECVRAGLETESDRTYFISPVHRSPEVNSILHVGYRRPFAVMEGVAPMVYGVEGSLRCSRLLAALHLHTVECNSLNSAAICADAIDV